MKRTLLCIVGAGASIPANVPSTDDLLEPVLSALPNVVVPGTQFRPQRYLGQPMSFGSEIKLGDILRPAIVAHHGRIDFELVLRSIESLMSYAGDTLPIAAYTEARRKYEVLMNHMLLSDAQEAVIRAVAREISVRQPWKPEHREAIINLERLFRSLSRKFRLVLSTLNYDDLLDNVLPWNDGFEEVADQPGYALFDPVKWRAAERTPEPLLMHLHGSVRFGFARHGRAKGGQNDQPARYDAPHLAAAANDGAYASSVSVDGQHLIGSSMIAGGDKGAKLVYNMRPYAYYFSCLQRMIVDSDAMLIVGYGWGDEHVNQLIFEFASLFPERRICVITKRSARSLGSLSNLETSLRRLGKDEWSKIENFTYDRFGSGASPSRSHAAAGRLYVVTTGMPLRGDERKALISFLAES